MGHPFSHFIRLNSITLSYKVPGLVSTNFKNAAYYVVNDNPGKLQGEAICISIGYDFAQHIHEYHERPHGVDLPQSTTPPSVPGGAPGTVRCLTTISSVVRRTNPVIDENRLEEIAPSINIGSVDPEHEYGTQHRMMDRARDSVRDFRAEPHDSEKSPPEPETNSESSYKSRLTSSRLNKLIDHPAPHFQCALHYAMLPSLKRRSRGDTCQKSKLFSQQSSKHWQAKIL